MNAFERAKRDMFACRDITEEAEFLPGGDSAAAFTVTVIKKSPIESLEMGSSSMIAEKTTIRVLAESLERLGRDPKRGDELEIGGKTRRIANPVRDARGLAWEIEVN